MSSRYAGSVTASQGHGERTQPYDASALRKAARSTRVRRYTSPEPIESSVLGVPPTTPPSAAKAAIKARILQASLGAARPALLDGRYHLLREIGRGGVGVLWEARQEPLGRRVAIKFLRGHAKRSQARLLREAQAIASLDHPHIVRVFDVGTDGDGSPYVVMELLDGPSLAAYVDTHAPLPTAEVRRIALQLCDALASAHRLGIVHRDVKPANVLATPHRSGHLMWKLVDFGLSTRFAGNPDLKQDEGGTPGYMAPEQIRKASVDARSDVYAVGCVLYELLTGRPRFVGRNANEIMKAQLDPRVDEDAAVPTEWRSIIAHALQPAPEDRFPTIVAMATAIRSTVPRPTKRHRRGIHPLLSFVLGVLTTLLAMVAFLAWYGPMERLIEQSLR